MAKFKIEVENFEGKNVGEIYLFEDQNEYYFQCEKGSVFNLNDIQEIGSVMEEMQKLAGETK